MKAAAQVQCVLLLTLSLIRLLRLLVECNHNEVISIKIPNVSSKANVMAVSEEVQGLGS